MIGRSLQLRTKSGPVDRQHVILNAALFQTAWLLCVIGGTAVALPVTVVILGIHLSLVPQAVRELQFIGFATVLGLVSDMLLLRAGVLNIEGAIMQPLWLLCLWPLFATTFGYALRWLHDRFWICPLAGALLAPLSYLGGSRLAGIELLEPLPVALAIIGLAWALIFPLLMLVYQGLYSRSPS